MGTVVSRYKTVSPRLTHDQARFPDFVGYEQREKTAAYTPLLVVDLYVSKFILLSEITRTDLTKVHGLKKLTKYRHILQ